MRAAACWVDDLAQFHGLVVWGREGKSIQGSSDQIAVELFHLEGDKDCFYCRPGIQQVYDQLLSRSDENLTIATKSIIPVYIRSWRKYLSIRDLWFQPSFTSHDSVRIGGLKQAPEFYFLWMDAFEVDNQGA